MSDAYVRRFRNFGRAVRSDVSDGSVRFRRAVAERFRGARNEIRSPRDEISGSVAHWKGKRMKGEDVLGDYDNERRMGE